MSGRMRQMIENIRRRAPLLVMLILALLVGFALRALLVPRPVGLTDDDGHEHVAGESETVWTCSMHPQIKLPSFGLCPICNMDLIPLDGSDDRGLRRLSISPAAARLLDVETSLVDRRSVSRPVRMVGRVDYDETRLKEITAWVGGRLDRLYVDFTGVTVRRGDHLAELFSPELLGAQEELLQALRSVRELDARGQDERGIVSQTVRGTLHASREKLRLLGLSDEQIMDIESSGRVSDHVTINSPIGGIVIEKNVQQGAYVETGTRIYSIADLSQVWVRLDAYESDLPWLRYGQQVSFTTEALPGEEFLGVITFVDPVLTEATRTVKLRVNVINPEMKLKPGIFVRAVVESRLTASGRAASADLSGKWISPMHPEIIKDGPGECDVCGMPLVRAESLGLVDAAGEGEELPLVIPASAVLQTGKRAVVYLQINPSVFDFDAIQDWPALVTRLRVAADAPRGDAPVAADPASRIWQMLRPGLRQDLRALDMAAEPPGGLKHGIIADFNRLLERRDLYQPDYWQAIELDNELRGLLRQGIENLPAERIARVNRMLLEAAFPDQLVTSVDRPTFEGRQIVLGARAGDYYIVRHGLAVGDRVVTRGQFKLDSELQINARPSMMSPPGGGAAAAGVHDHGDGAAMDEAMASGVVEVPALARPQLQAVLYAGQQLAESARADDLAAMQQSFAELGRAVADVPVDRFSGEAGDWWREYAMLLGNDVYEGREAGSLHEARRAADLALGHLSAMQQTFGLGNDHGPAAIDARFHRQLAPVVEAYLAMQRSLANDEPAARAAEIAGRISEALGQVDMTLVAGEDHDVWMRQSQQMTAALRQIAGERNDLEAARAHFKGLSDALITVVRRFGAPGPQALYVAHCPMAFNDTGADWLQSDERVLNSYEGSRMLRCGEIRQVIQPAREAAVEQHVNGAEPVGPMPDSRAGHEH